MAARIYVPNSCWNAESAHPLTPPLLPLTIIEAMLRIFKHYTFNLTQLQPAANRLSFSSYPGGAAAALLGPAGRPRALCALALWHAHAEARSPAACGALAVRCAPRWWCSCCAGELFSDDDLFITDAQLVVMQVGGAAAASEWHWLPMKLHL